MFRGIMNLLTMIVGDRAALQINKMITGAVAKIKLGIDIPEDSKSKYSRYAHIIRKVSSLSERKP
jgi:hypothetical protein